MDSSNNSFWEAPLEIPLSQALLKAGQNVGLGGAHVGMVQSAGFDLQAQQFGAVSGLSQLPIWKQKLVCG